MKYFLYFVVAIIIVVIFAVIGINIPDWIQEFISIWFWTYIGLHVLKVIPEIALNKDVTQKEIKLSSKQVFKLSFILSILIDLLILLPSTVVAVIVLLVILGVVLFVIKLMQ